MDDHNVYVEIKKLPSFSVLNEKVRDVERHSTWWELHGLQWAHIMGGVGAAGVGLLLMRSGGVLSTVVGIILLGAFNVITTQNGGHLASHNALARSKDINKFWCVTFVEVLGSYSEYMGVDIHIRCHHPHTNIIGLGDSSSWKASFLPRFVYLFVAPLILPVMTPLVAVGQLVELKVWHAFIRYIPLMVGGIAARVCLFHMVCGYSVLTSLLAIWAYQAVFSIPYIHINIFQHIGLPMYSQENRPVRIYQMATGVLNLERNPILDLTFGHALVNCHVEHHLFPRLSDNMCLKIKPLVRQYLLDNGLPYHEKSYSNRLSMFTSGYKALMVKAPPITHFIGLQ